MYETIHILEGHRNSVQCLSISPDATILASGAADESIRIWNVLTGKLKRAIEVDGMDTHSIEFSPDGLLVASGSADGIVRLWQVSDGKVQQTFNEHTNWVKQVKFSPDGTTLASVADDINVRRVSDGRLLYTIEANTIQGGLYFSPDGSTITAANSDSLLRFKTSTGKTEAKIKWRLFASGVTFSPDRTVMASRFLFADFVTLWLILPKNGRDLLCKLERHTDAIFSIVFSPDIDVLASGSKDNTVMLWDISMDEHLATLKGHKGTIFSLAFSSDNKTLASGSDDKTIRIWRTGNSKNTK